MINNIYTSFLSETKKVKGTFTFWFTLLGSILIPFIFFLVYFFRFESFIPQEGVNPWNSFIKNNLQAIAVLLFPLHVILTIAININIEHKGNNWKKLFVLPVKRESIYIGKLLFLLFQIAISLLLFFSVVLIFGYLLGIIYHQLFFLDFHPNIINFIKSIARLFISILGICSIQYVLGLYFKNIIVPISLGIFLTIVATLITQGWEYAIYFPYAFPTLFFMDSKKLLSESITTYYGLTISEITSVATFFGVNICGALLFKRKRIK